MKRASTGEVMKLINPFVHTKFLAASYVNFEDVGKIQAVLSLFENVSVKLKDKGDGYAYLGIRISRFLAGKELDYGSETIITGRRYTTIWAGSMRSKGMTPCFMMEGKFERYYCRAWRSPRCNLQISDHVTAR